MKRLNSSDIFYLKKTLLLARRGRGWANPNPMVGAVIVKNKTIIGQGYFQRMGEAHAEVMAIKSAKKSCVGATLYVSLEPHSFYGHSAPCTAAIIKAKIKRVVCVTADPNPKVSGRGFKQLHAAGIVVTIGGPVGEAKQLNEAYFKFHQSKRPFVAIKFAASLDGKIATRTGDSKWITNNALRVYTRSLRGQYQAILVGVNTVIKDNPHLGARTKNERDPLRIILDSNLRTPPKSKVLRDKNVLIIASAQAPRSRFQRFKKQGVRVARFLGRTPAFKKILRFLYQENIISLMVEGGSSVLGEFVDNRAVDKAYVCLAPIIIGGQSSLTAIGGAGTKTVASALRLSEVKYKNFGDNLLIEGVVAN